MKIKVKFLKDFPYQTVAEDLNTYGPFKEGEVAELPPLYASSFIARGYVEVVK